MTVESNFMGWILRHNQKGEKRLFIEGPGATVARPQVGKLVVTCCWSAVYSKEP